ncbi:MAG TPA: hypothetical protein VJ891_09725 [Casimicrobiaceae bacterium]|nr:hypothetical protein [Casimicrobiaceae bacterium]
MSSEANKALMRRFYAEIDKGNIGTVDEIVDENEVDHNPPPFPLPSWKRRNEADVFNSSESDTGISRN